MQVFVCAIGNLDAVRRDASVLVVQFCSLGDIAAEAEHKFPARLHFGAGADPFILHTITHPAVRFFFVFSSRFAFLSFPSCGCVDGVVGRAGGSTAFPTRFFFSPTLSSSSALVPLSCEFFSLLRHTHRLFLLS